MNKYILNVYENVVIKGWIKRLNMILLRNLLYYGSYGSVPGSGFQTGKDLPKELVKNADSLPRLLRDFEFIRSVEGLRNLKILRSIQSNSTASRQR